MGFDDKGVPFLTKSGFNKDISKFRLALFSPMSTQYEPDSKVSSLIDR
jgi:hypothetical protein